MGQANPYKPTALVVEDDGMQREMLALLLEESDMCVIECESAEAAVCCARSNGKRADAGVHRHQPRRRS